MLLDVDIAAKDHNSPGAAARRVLADLRLSLNRGEAGAVLGPSGCGKTTLLRIVAGLDRDFSGRVVLPSHSRLAMAFQEPRLLPWRSVADNIRIAAPQASSAEIAALLRDFGLSGHAAQFPGELSLGLARRVSLARALAIKPDLLLLDEPLVSLDAALAADLRLRLARVIDETAATTLLVTHDVADAVALANRIFILSPPPSSVAATIEIDAPRGRMTANAARDVEQKARTAMAAFSRASP